MRHIFFDQIQAHDIRGGSTVYNPFRVLGLPVKIRKDIFALAGLVRSCPIDVNEERDRWKNRIEAYKYSSFPRFPSRDIRFGVLGWQWNRCAYDAKADGCVYKPSTGAGHGCVHPRLPIELLLVSKQIYQEAFEVLYSRNIILLSPGTFLPVSAMRWITLLEVRLTTSSCVVDHECDNLTKYQEFHPCQLCHYYCKRGSGAPLSLKAITSNGVFQYWQALCQELVANCHNIADFTLICDTADSATARSIIAPLQGLHVQNATVRLGQSPWTELAGLASSTVSELTATRVLASFQRFPDLPVELQELILSFTDLIAPTYISWNEPIKDIYEGREWQRLRNRSKHFRLLLDDLHRCCLNCSLSREVCACPSRHAGSSSKRCNCWDFPSSFFIVGKPFSAMADRVFFSKNKFVIWETSQIDLRSSWGRLTSDGSCQQYLEEPIRILSTIPQRFSAHLCWFRFVFCYGNGIISEDPDYESYWLRLIDHLRQNFVVNQLTIELDFAYMAKGDQLILFEREDAVLERFKTITRMFRSNDLKQCYKDFFVRCGYATIELEKDWQRWQLESELEQEIMGRGYNAADRGKYQDTMFYHNERIQPKRYLRTHVLWHDVRWDDERFFRPVFDFSEISID